VNEERFRKMMEGIKQGAEILKGKRKPARITERIIHVPDAKKIREDLNLSQSQFADMLGVSVRTIQNWEQGLRVPNRPSAMLLMLAATHPDVFKDLSRATVTASTHQQTVNETAKSA